MIIGVETEAEESSSISSQFCFILMLLEKAWIQLFPTRLDSKADKARLLWCGNQSRRKKFEFKKSAWRDGYFTLGCYSYSTTCVSPISLIGYRNHMWLQLLYTYKTHYTDLCFQDAHTLRWLTGDLGGASIMHTPCWLGASKMHTVPICASNTYFLLFLFFFFFPPLLAETIYIINICKHNINSINIKFWQGI